MAKSLRSKWKRKMRAEKRVRYGKKEDARLRKMVEEHHNKNDAKMEEDANDKKEEETVDDVESKPMETSEAAVLRLKNEHGNYPVWMSHRKIQQLKMAKKSRGANSKVEKKVNKVSKIKKKRPKVF